MTQKELDLDLSRQELYDIALFMLKDESTCLSENYKKEEIACLLDDEVPINCELIGDMYNEVIHGYLKLCGCYDPELAAYSAMKLLKLFQLQDDNAKSIEREAIIKRYLIKYFGKERIDEVIGTDGFALFTLYTLDDYGLIEHGCNIRCAWLTEKGRIVIKVLDKMFKEYS